MKLLPAIDLMDGQCVRLKQGEYAERTTYPWSPLQMAELFEKMRYEWLHIIDLDGAREGESLNKKTIQAILASTGLKVQVGGGIRSLARIEEWFELGVSRVLLGTLAMEQPEVLLEAVKKFGPEAIVVTMDIKEGVIRTRGWKEAAPLKVEDFISRLISSGVRSIFCTDISRDGMQEGPNVELYKKLVRDHPEIYWTAAGGIRTPHDRKKLEKVGVKEAIIGSLFYEGSLLTKRIIPCLDVKEGRTVKGIQFLNLKDAGDPIELAKTYAQQGADELVFLDITAAKENRSTMLDWVRKVAEVTSIPFTVGGGISSVEDIRSVLECGADKVSLNSAIIKNPALINEASQQFGSQCIVAAVDVKKTPKGWKVFVKGGSEETDWDALDWIQEVERRGAGEILLTSMDSDGTKQGFDLELLRAVKSRTSLPVIASGGAGSMQDFADLFKENLAEAGLAASVFHYGEIPIPQLKQHLISQSIMMRL